MSERAQLLRRLHMRREATAEQWYQAIARICYVALSRDRVRRRLVELTGQAIDLLLGELPLAAEAEEIGVALADMHYLQPEALGRTLGVLGDQLVEGLPDHQVAELRPRLVALLEGVATGFFRKVCQMVLAEQEAVREALVHSLRDAGESLRQAHDHLEQQVAERTAELARANRDLRLEIGEREQAQAALRESEQRWRSLVENAPDVILTLDRDRRITFINRTPRASVKAVDEITGTEAVEYTLPAYLDTLAGAIDNVFATGESEYCEMPSVTSTGESVWYAAHMGPIWRDGEVVSVLLIAREITGRKQVDEIKDNLIRDVSHELRTPLSKVQMSLELLSELLEEEQLDRQRALRISRLSTRNAKSLFQVVDGILDLSRIEAGVWTYEEAEIQPAVLIHEAVVYMEPLAVAKGLELVARLPEALPLIRGDWEKLFRVLINLVDNAIKFSEEGQVVVSAATGDGEVVFAVSDSGIGILPENLERVFERFYQEKIRNPGTGVGLTICRAIIENHGGRIWAESAGRGQGATFYFALPICGG